MKKWLDVKAAGDRLAQFVANNVTSEMGLALLDIADALRAHPAAVAALPNLTDAAFLAELSSVKGGDEAARAIRGFLATYGMRCPGEITSPGPGGARSRRCSSR